MSTLHVEHKGLRLTSNFDYNTESASTVVLQVYIAHVRSFQFRLRSLYDLQYYNIYSVHVTYNTSVGK